MKIPRFCRICFSASIVLLGMISSAAAQSGGSYKIERSVTAAGGGTSNNAGSNVYKVESTIGQPFAGTTSGAGAFSLHAGFWSAAALTPTAGGVSISGRILTPENRGLLNARVTITDSAGQSRTVMTGAGGSFSFTDVSAGATYILSVTSKRYPYAPQIITVNESLTDMNFTPTM